MGLREALNKALWMSRSARAADTANLFSVASRNDFTQLKRWLKRRRFNYSGYFRDDCDGNPIIALAHGHDPDNDMKFPAPEWFIVVTDTTLLREVEIIAMGFEVE
jgi:hypothetical protein